MAAEGADTGSHHSDEANGPSHGGGDTLTAKIEDARLDEGTESPQTEDIADDVDAETRLKQLATAVRDQNDLERDIGRQVCICC